MTSVRDVAPVSLGRPLDLLEGRDPRYTTESAQYFSYVMIVSTMFFTLHN
jgi:hypothetical protein